MQEATHLDTVRAAPDLHANGDVLPPPRTKPRSPTKGGRPGCAVSEGLSLGSSHQRLNTHVKEKHMLFPMPGLKTVPPGLASDLEEIRRKPPSQSFPAASPPLPAEEKNDSTVNSVDATCVKLEGDNSLSKTWM